MKLTTKGRYAVMAMADLASNEDIKPVSLNEIAIRQNISLKLMGFKFSLVARSAIAITAYRPFVVNFILFQCYLMLISLFPLK